jgi:orotidine-5'-phosphate decarboxylase
MNQLSASQTAPQRPALAARERLIVALDLTRRDEAWRVVEALGDSVLFYKVGLQLAFAGGLGMAAELVKGGKRVFLDLKLHDIDQQVERAVGNLAEKGIDFLTVHGQGRAIEAAVRGRADSDLKIFAVTVLTSLGSEDLAADSIGLSLPELVVGRARRAMEAGSDGVIASGMEATAIREMAGNRLLIVTPGIRSEGVPHHDQKRVTTPRQAIARGADYLVVGRQILEAEDPAAMAEQIVGEIEAAI